MIADCESDISHYLRYQNLSKGNPYVDCQIITPIRMAEELVQAYGALYEPQQAFRSISKDMAVMLLYPNGIYENLLRGKLDAAGFSYAFPCGTHAASEDYICFLLSMIDFAESDYDYRNLEKLITNPVCKLPGKYRSYRKVLREGIGWGKDRYLFFVQKMREQNMGK